MSFNPGGGAPFLSFVAGQGIAPNANPATLVVWGTTLHGTYSYDNVTAQSILYEGVMPRSYNPALGLTVVAWVLSTAVTGNFVLSAAFEYIEPGVTDLDADSFATAILSASTAINGTSGIATLCPIVLTGAEADNLVPGAAFRLAFARVPGDAGDDMAAAAQVLRVSLYQ